MMVLYLFKVLFGESIRGLFGMLTIWILLIGFVSVGFCVDVV
jgi:hypothetical protein